MANGTLKVSNIQTSSGSGTITLGQSGETVDFSNATATLNSAMKMTPAFQASLGSTLALTDATLTLLSASVESYDSDGCYNNTGSTVTLNGILNTFLCFCAKCCR